MIAKAGLPPPPFCPPFHTQADKKPSSSPSFQPGSGSSSNGNGLLRRRRKRESGFEGKKKKADLNPLLFRPPPTLIPPPFPCGQGKGGRRNQSPTFFLPGKEKGLQSRPKSGGNFAGRKKRATLLFPSPRTRKGKRTLTAVGLPSRGYWSLSHQLPSQRKI